MIKVAFRNLARRKRRTMITAASIGFGVWLAVLTIGIRESTYQRFVLAGAQAGYGYLTVGDQGFQPSQPSLSSLPEATPLIEKLEAIPGVIKVLPRRVGEAVLQSTRRNTGSAWLAVDPKREGPGFNLFCQNMLGGACDATWQKGALIGATLAKNLQLKQGDQLIYTFQHAPNQNISLMTEIRGIFQTGSEELDGHLFMLPLDEVNSQLPPESRSISYLATFVADSYAVDQIFPLIKAQLGTEQLMTWQKTQPDLDEYFAADRIMYYTMLAFVVLIIAAGVTTCTNMNIIERRREMGTLLAIGMFPLQLLQLLLTEAFCLAWIGLSLGIVTVAPFFLYLHFHGFDFSPYVAEADQLGHQAGAEFLIGCSLHWIQVFSITATIFLISLLAALYPALSAAYTLPIKILREA